MPRSARSARGAGTSHETAVARYFAVMLGSDVIERRARNGAKDRGDVGGVRHLGQRVVVECKDAAGKYAGLLGAWISEAETERGNDDAGVGLVVFKRKGKGHPGDQFVVMTLRDLLSLLTGSRQEEGN